MLKKQNKIYFFNKFKLDGPLCWFLIVYSIFVLAIWNKENLIFVPIYSEKQERKKGECKCILKLNIYICMKKCHFVFSYSTNLFSCYI
jgi:hypothetical protein